MGGERAGRGSTFHFTIKAEKRSMRPEDHWSGVQPQLVGKSVLIVDDNRTNRRILGGYAYSWGMVPLIASIRQGCPQLDSERRYI